MVNKTAIKQYQQATRDRAKVKTEGGKIIRWVSGFVGISWWQLLGWLCEVKNRVLADRLSGASLFTGGCRWPKGTRLPALI